MNSKIKRPFGKQIECNLVRSLVLAGIDVSTGVDLDHNFKCDFVLRIDRQPVGVQFSLRRDLIKARAAKSCALDRVSRFIYLRLDQDFFDRPDRQNGKDLFRILAWIVGEHPCWRALWVDIGKLGMNVRPL